jgi:YD repeat-containing protein
MDRMSICRRVFESLGRWQWLAVGAMLLSSVADGAEVNYQYDEAGRLRRATHGSELAVTYVLDAAGNRTSVTTAMSPGIVQLSTNNYSGGEAAGQRAITITVTRTHGSSGAVSVPYTVTAGTATAGSDYTASNGTLSWAAGDTASKSFTITVIDDAVFEPNETLTVTLGEPTGGAALGSPSSATVTISSDDAQPAGSLQFSASTFSGGEASGQRTITISVTRVNGSNGAVNVPYTVTAGSATAGSDYTASNGTLSWASGDTANKTFTITVVDDSTFESNETLTVALGTPTGGATLGSPSSATVTIVSDDNPPTGSLQLSSSSYSGGEAAGQRTITITVTRTGGSFNPAVVAYTVSPGTATAGSDYTASNGVLEWANGDAASKSFTITVLDDGIIENNETLTVTLGAAGGASSGSPSSATVTIVSDDAHGSIQLTATSYSGSEEPGGGQILVTATRTGGVAGSVHVVLNVTQGTALENGDFTRPISTFSWPDGDGTPKTVAFRIINDTLYEPNETFTISINNPFGGATLGSPTTATLTIISDDNPSAGSVQLSSATFSGGEAPGTQNITISASRTGGSDGAGSVPYSVTGVTATPGVDYTASNGTLSWANGDAANKSFTITVIDDAVFESNETLTVSLGTPTWVSLGVPNTATVTIADNEAGGQVNIDNRFISTQGFQSAEAHYTLTSGGDIFTNVQGVSNSNQDTGDWINPKVGMSNFEVHVSGSGSRCEGLVWNTWVSLSQTRGWGTSAQNTDGGGDVQGCTLTVSLRAASNPSVILDTAVIDLLATAQ